MNRFNSQNIMKQLENMAVRFPISILFIALLALWEISLVQNAFQSSPTPIVFITGILLATASQLFYERFYKKKGDNRIRWLLYAGVILLMALYYFYFSMNQDKVDGSWTIYSIPGIRAMIVYFIATLLLAWIPSIKSEMNFSESFLVVFKGYFASGFFASILFLGIIAVFFLFERLFFSLEIDWSAYTYIFTFKIFSPVYFLTFIPDYEALHATEEDNHLVKRAIEMPNFLDKLISYILIPIMAVYTVLLVLYIVSNLTSAFFEDNLLEGLTLTYAINGWTLLILADLLENKATVYFRKLFPFSLIFVLIFQMLATYQEIQAVGITHGRYFILLFGVVSIISALWYIWKEPKLWLLPIASLIAGLIALVPPFDAVGLSVRNQVNRVENLLEENNILGDNGQITPNREVHIDTKDKVNESIRYLRSIQALNQLSWLPEDLYNQTHELFGFKDDIVTEPSVEVERYTVEILDRDQYSLPIDRYDFMLQLSMEEDEQKREAAMVDGEIVSLHFDLEDGFLLTLEPESTSEEISFDFSEIFDAFETEDAYLPIEQMRFVEENEGYTATIYVKYLYVYDDQFVIEFLLFL